MNENSEEEEGLHRNLLFSCEPSFSLDIVYFNNVNNKFASDSLYKYNQNPFQLNEWPKSNSLEFDESENYKYTTKNQINFKRYFDEKYNIILPNNTTSQIQLQQRPLNTSTRPFLYEIEPKNSFKDIILHNHIAMMIGGGINQRLIMKLVPLYDKHCNILHENFTDEIFNEIIVGYFLNRLVYCYVNVLSIHFRTLIDWFIVRKESIIPHGVDDFDNTQQQYYNGSYSNQFTYTKHDHSKKFHQAIIMEKTDITVYDYLLKTVFSVSPLKVLKAIIFEVFHSMEIAWYTNEYIHHDLHLRNVMLTNISQRKNVFKDKDFLYKRALGNNDCWYQIDNESIQDHIVKIIDYGRNRMMVPSSIDNNKKHDFLIEMVCYDHQGYSTGTQYINRQLDVYTFLLSILNLPKEYWERKILDEEYEPFFQFCNDLIPFEEINDIVDRLHVGHPLSTNRRKINDNTKLDAKTFTQLSKDNKEFFAYTGTFIYKKHYNDITVTKALDNAFFDDYKKPSLLNKNISKTSIVVSFPRCDDKMNNNVIQSNVHCSVCGSEKIDKLKALRSYNYICDSNLCYEFLSLFNSKTVLR
jgi:hypothetical protein